MKVVTFYSFRGGVGRSLAVANVAYAMVESGERRVLVVDFDLEAPGLSFMDFLQPEKPAPRGGVFEFAKSYQSRHSPDLADYISPVKDKPKNLYFMRAGDLAAGYDVSKLDINRLLSPRRRKANLVDYFRAQAESLHFHYVLVDSRTGLTELGGMCTVGLPDLVVVLTGLNQQNLEGTRWVLQNIRTHGRDPKQAIVAFSHLPDSEEELRRRRMNGALRLLGVKHKPIFLPYHARMSLVEELFLRSWPDTPLAAAYRDLALAIREKNDEDIETVLREVENTRLFWWERPGRRPPEHPLLEAEVGRAAGLVRRAMALYPDSARLAQEAGKLYATARKYAEAVPLLERYAYAAREFDPQSHALLLTSALRAGEARALDREIRRIRAMLRPRASTQPAGATEELFRVLIRGLPDVLSFQTLQIDPRVAVPTLRLVLDGCAFLAGRSSGDHQKAVLYDSAASHMLMLHYYEPEANHPKQALRWARKAARLAPPHGKYNWACALALLGRRREALEALKGLPPEQLRHADPATDRDWERYWDDPEFREILERAHGEKPPASQGASGHSSPARERRGASGPPAMRRR